jgi:uncharacterized protein (TIGR00290 family)
MISVQGHPFFCSWSGGKDSCLALYRAIQEKGRPQVLLTMLTEGGERSRSHGLPLTFIQKQACALGIRLISRAASWQDYETTFVSALGAIKKEGIEIGVFGDIDIDSHREWVERVCGSARIRPYHPLWKKARRDLLKEFLAAGFQATIIAVKDELLGPQFLGRTLDAEAVRELEQAGVDASGEGGEYHTVVTAGPLFSSPLPFRLKGQALRDGYRFADISA